MAERRMFSKSVIRTDKFIDMPLSAQALYLHLSMEADDDGFITSAKMVQRSIGASEDDMKLLIVKGFVIPFESGVVVIAHWKKSNYIQKDRYKPTTMIQERAMIVLENDVYRLDTDCIQGVSNLDTTCIQNGSVGKDRIGKVRLGKDRVVATTKHDVSGMDTSCVQNGSNMDTDCIQGVSTDNDNPDGLADKAAAAVFSTFEECGFAINQHASSRLIGLINDYSAKWVTEAIKRAADRGRKNLGYVEGILSSWKQKGAMDDGRREGSGTASRAPSRTDERIGGTIV